ncbi:MAG: restriction endonuclease subunit S [Candidatus Kerfeldbacteria bacterium]|nr:restriction endonuclease subunit S [Candidatus Kerfeldbacteria bacterium]
MSTRVTVENESSLKTTEVGAIPRDWDLVSFDDAFEFLRTASYSREQLGANGDYQYIHYGDIHTKWSFFVDMSKARTPTVDRGQAGNYSQIKEGDLILADASEDYAGVAKSVEVINLGEKKAIAGLHTFLLRDKGNNFVDGFKGYITSSPLVKPSLDRYATGLKVFGISKNNLKLVPIPKPPSEQQKAIVKALRDTDALIESLEKLIAKKRAIKQGVMQELLTGKRRLPGFTKAWTRERIGDCTQIVSGGTPRTDRNQYWNGGIKWCTPTDITGTFGKYLHDTQRSISQAGLKSCAARLLPAGTLLLCSRATIGEVRIATDQICTNQGFKSLVCSDRIDNEFLYYLLLTLKQKMIEKAIGSTFLEIGKRELAALEIPYPPIEEQRAIAMVLCELDTELELQQSRLQKLTQVKQGMMQSLLTGKIRLTV